jgi:hypothetical protein
MLAVILHIIIHAPVFTLVVRTGPASYWSQSLSALERLMNLWQSQDTRWCQWAIISRPHILYYACS